MGVAMIHSPRGKKLGSCLNCVQIGCELLRSEICMKSSPAYRDFQHQTSGSCARCFRNTKVSQISYSLLEKFPEGNIRVGGKYKGRVSKNHKFRIPDIPY